MGDRYRDIKGSSRPTRDDSRRSKEKRRRHSRSRSRSPHKRQSSPSSHKYERSEREDHYNDKKPTQDNWEDSDEEVPAPPPPPRISKISMGFSKAKAPIKMTIGNTSKPPPPKATVASVFNPDEDDEPEEMPAEARMRMRNIGRETPTSAGPNSFGKTKQGFCDAKKVFEKNLKQALETAEKPTGKLPQTIYKIKGP